MMTSGNAFGTPAVCLGQLVVFLGFESGGGGGGGGGACKKSRYLIDSLSVISIVVI